jgi:peptidyl-dipeptidase A
MIGRMPALRLVIVAAAVMSIGTVAACRNTPPTQPEKDASAFLAAANDTLLGLGVEWNQAGWVQNTYITPDTEALSARASEAYMTAATNFSKQATQYDDAEVSALERRQLTVLKNALTMAAPADPKEAAELAQLVASMEGMYGRGKFCRDGESDQACLDIEEITEILAKDRNPARLLDVWEGWHSIAPPMKKSYARFAELSNKGARELGFADTGAMWRSNSIVCGPSCSRCMCRCTLTFVPGCTSATVHWCRTTDRSPRTCWATSGRRTGRTFTTSSGRRWAARASR